MLLLVIDLTTLPIGHTSFSICTAVRVFELRSNPTRIAFAFYGAVSWHSFWAVFPSGLFCLGLAACVFFSRHPYLNRGLPFVHDNLSLATF